MNCMSVHKCAIKSLKTSQGNLIFQEHITVNISTKPELSPTSDILYIIQPIYKH